MKLTKFLIKKCKACFKKTQCAYPLILDDCLTECLEYMFPGEGFVRFYLHDVARDMQKLETADARPYFDKVSDARNLIFHIRDNAWLAQHLSYQLACHPCAELAGQEKLSLATLEKFVAQSPKFDAKRREFEGYLVKSYISECLDYQSDDFYTRSIEKILESSSPNYDKLFRDRVVKAMKYLGVSEHSIETSLEVNAQLWRKDVMGLAFANRYHDLGVTYTKGRTFQIPHRDVVDTKSVYHKYVNHRNMPEVYLLPRENMKQPARTVYDNWLCLREYEYYLNHQKVIDEMGTATRSMKISRRQAKKIAQLLKDFEKQNSLQKG